MNISPILLLFLAFFGGVCASLYAKRRQKNPFLWFFIGMVSIFLGFFFIFLNSSKKKKHSSDCNISTNNSNKEQCNIQQNSLNIIDKSNLSEETAKVFNSKNNYKNGDFLITPAFFFKEEFRQRLWYYLDKDNKHQGPLSMVALKKRFHMKAIDHTTHVWSEKMESWKRISDLTN